MKSIVVWILVVSGHGHLHMNLNDDGLTYHLENGVPLVAFSSEAECQKALAFQEHGACFSFQVMVGKKAAKNDIK